jgi:hypothetical protein
VITSASTEVVYGTHQRGHSQLTSFSGGGSGGGGNVSMGQHGSDVSSGSSTRDTTPTTHRDGTLRQQQRQDSAATLTPQLVTQATQQWHMNPVYSVADKPPLPSSQNRPHVTSTNYGNSLGATITLPSNNNNGHERNDSANFSLTSSESGQTTTIRDRGGNYVQ